MVDSGWAVPAHITVCDVHVRTVLSCNGSAAHILATAYRWVRSCFGCIASATGGRHHGTVSDAVGGMRAIADGMQSAVIAVLRSTKGPELSRPH